mmetsp:Transcript_15046/g.42224  ORF Transcript_15046/g.42224 Transcript_15046/m.42224 type:complete len:238 (+) Transcript_15046:96-809(+)
MDSPAIRTTAAKPFVTCCHSASSTVARQVPDSSGGACSLMFGRQLQGSRPPGSTYLVCPRRLGSGLQDIQYLFQYPLTIPIPDFNRVRSSPNPELSRGADDLRFHRAVRNSSPHSTPEFGNTYYTFPIYLYIRRRNPSATRRQWRIRRQVGRWRRSSRTTSRKRVMRLLRDGTYRPTQRGTRDPLRLLLSAAASLYDTIPVDVFHPIISLQRTLHQAEGISARPKYNFRNSSRLQSL